MKLFEKIALTGMAHKNCAATNLDWLDKHEDALQRIERTLLPSGSGFDAGTKIVSVGYEKIVLESAYHLLDSDGYYRQWIDFKIVVKPALFGEITVKAVGKFAAIEKTSYGYGTRDYIEETFYNVLTTEYRD